MSRMGVKDDPNNGPINCADQKVIHRLYEKMAKAAAWKACTIVGCRDVANEIAQEVFIKLWQGGGTFPNEKAVYAWIYKAAHHAAIDYVRSAGVRREAHVEVYPDDVVSPGQDHQDVLIARELVSRYIGELSEDEADVFVYAVVDRMTQNEIADVTGKSRRTVQRIMARIEERYQEIRGKYGN